MTPPPTTTARARLGRAGASGMAATLGGGYDSPSGAAAGGRPRLELVASSARLATLDLLQAAHRRPREDLLRGHRPLGAAAADEAHRPVQQRRDPVLEADEVDDVDEEPGQPGDEAGQLEPADLRDRGEPRDRRHVALVEVVERLFCDLAVEPSDDPVRGVLAALHRDLRDARQAEAEQVADHED